MEDIKARAEAILRGFKGDAYAFGSGILDEAAGKFAAQMGKKAMGAKLARPDKSVGKIWL